MCSTSNVEVWNNLHLHPFLSSSKIFRNHNIGPPLSAAKKRTVFSCMILGSFGFGTDCYIISAILQRTCRRKQQCLFIISGRTSSWKTEKDSCGLIPCRSWYNVQQRVQRFIYNGCRNVQITLKYKKNRYKSTDI